MKNYQKTLNKGRILVPLMIIFSLLITNIVAGLGITPGRTTLDYEPGLNKNISFSIINSDKKNISVVFYVKGDLNESISLPEVYSEFSPDEESKSFYYNVDLPDEIKKPGLHKAEIGALELPKDIKKTGKFVGATLSVMTQLYVHVPYPGKYLEIESNVVNSYKDSEVLFLIPVINRGELGIKNAKAIIDIYNYKNEKVASIESNSQSLKSSQRKELVASWKANVTSGPYLAKITVVYDGKTASMEKEFKVGDKILEISKIEVNDFKLGGIAKLNSLVENKYNSKIKDAYLILEVYNEKGEVMTEIKSPTYDIEPLSKTNMVSYWDTAGVSEGVYEAKLSLKFDKGSFERNVNIKVSSDDIIVMGLSGEMVMEKVKGYSFQRLLIIAVIVLVILNIIWFVVVRKLFLENTQKDL